MLDQDKEERMRGDKRGRQVASGSKGEDERRTERKRDEENKINEQEHEQEQEQTPRTGCDGRRGERRESNIAAKTRMKREAKA